jgi:hypothetical protein
MENECTRQQKDFGVRVMWTIFLSNLKQTWIFSIDFYVKSQILISWKSVMESKLMHVDQRKWQSQQELCANAPKMTSENKTDAQTWFLTFDPA